MTETDKPEPSERLDIDHHASYWLLDMDEMIRQVILDGVKRERKYMYLKFSIKITVELG